MESYLNALDLNEKGRTSMKQPSSGNFSEMPTCIEDPDHPDFESRSNPHRYPQATSPAEIKRASRYYAKYVMGAMPPCPLEDISETLMKLADEAVERSSEVALAAHTLRARNGDAASCIHLGLCKLFGLGTPLVVRKAQGFFNLAIKLAAASSSATCATASIAYALILATLYMAPHTAAPEHNLVDRDDVLEGLGLAAKSVHHLHGKAIPDFVYDFCNYWEPKMKTWPEYKRSPEKWNFPQLWKLVHEQRAAKKANEAKLAKKLEKKPNRYICASQGCGIEAESGKALKRCSGKCQEDRKPYYCSSECQKKDWPHHKAFCRADAPARPPIATPKKGTDYDFEVFFKGLPNSDADIIRTVTSTTGKQYRIKGPREGVMGIVTIQDAAPGQGVRVKSL